MENPEWEQTCGTNRQPNECSCEVLDGGWFWNGIRGDPASGMHECAFDTSHYPESMSCITCRVNIQSNVG